MPELPEVYNVVQQLKPIEGLRIDSTEPLHKKFHDVCFEVVGKRIQEVSREGKFIIFTLDDGFLVSHLRMTGGWFLDHQPKHTKARFLLEGGKLLTFSSVRGFATLDYSKDDPRLTPPLSELGVDGLELGAPAVQDIIVTKAKKAKRPIKNFLMDQSVIAGNGNIYSSESLFAARIHPKTPTNKVREEDIIALCGLLNLTFLSSISKGGTSQVDYIAPDGNQGTYQDWLKVYSRAGESCYGCGEKIERIVQSGRATFFCPECQKYPLQDC